MASQSASDLPDGETLSYILEEEEGEYECDIWADEDQSELETARLSKINCKKNPNHSNFIPISKFKAEDLPGRFNDRDVFNYIHALSELTVRLKIGFNSANRPGNDPYAGLGSRVKRTGTGMITSVVEDPQTRPCPCRLCNTLKESNTVNTPDGPSTKNTPKGPNTENTFEEPNTMNAPEEPKTVNLSGGSNIINNSDGPNTVKTYIGPNSLNTCEGPNTVNTPEGPDIENDDQINDVKATRPWWYFRVFTAMHVVYDDSEAALTDIDIFFDNDDEEEVVDKYSVKPSDKRRRTTAIGYGIMNAGSFARMDRTFINCVTHDEALVKELSDCVIEMYKREMTLKDDIFKSRTFVEAKIPASLCAVVSHPHGCCKQITLGEWMCVNEREKLPDGYVFAEERYTADTCPGSSGAAILLIKEDPADSRKVRISQGTLGPLHCRGLKGSYNISKGFVYLHPDFDVEEKVQGCYTELENVFLQSVIAI